MMISRQQLESLSTAEVLKLAFIKCYKDNPFKYMNVLENTINELKIDIYNENMGLKNREQDPQKKALKFLNDNKKRFSSGRSCLAYACQTIINGEEVQVFTDSYIAFILKTFYKLPLWDNEKEMYIKLLELYERGLNSWNNTFEKDNHKTKKEKHRLNVYKKILLELNKVVDR